jgi:hypothetical protein
MRLSFSPGGGFALQTRKVKPSAMFKPKERYTHWGKKRNTRQEN